MDVAKINEALSKVFNEANTRIVFWNDPDGEFMDTVPSISLEGVSVLQLESVGALEAKIQVEQDEPTGRFLLYSSNEEPEYEDDWLLDIRLYSRSFRADRVSIILQELGVTQQSLRHHLSKRRKFFDSKERLSKLAAITTATDIELDLDRKMLSVVAKADQPELLNILRTLFHSMVDGDHVDLEAIPSVWEQIEKFELDEPFWRMIKSTFGYSSDAPTLKNLLIRLLVSDYAHYLVKSLPDSLQNLQLTRSGTENAVVCLAQWRDSSSKANSYNVLSTEIAHALHLQDQLIGFDVEDLLEVPTFAEVEKRVVQALVERITATKDAIDPEAIGRVIARRQAGHWVTSVSIPETQRKARHAVYEALNAGARFLHLRNEYDEGFDFPDINAMYKGYEDSLYRFDQIYRHFCENADIAASKGLDILKPLKLDIESCYCNWYLPKLSLAWGKFTDAQLPEQWSIKGIPNQYQFYEQHLKHWLDSGDKRRAFVIISDAMRYEVAHELTSQLNRTYRLRAKLSSQLGVLPSYTTLGMASLLPHDTLEYTPKAAVLADGKPTATLEQRSEVLSAQGGIAIKADQLLAMRKEEGRALVADKRVVYIYHDEIDARGDTASTESDTFDAARDTIQTVADLARYVINNLNASYVVVTADHGFLFTETAPTEPDKSKLDDKPAGTVFAKKRYLIGTDLPNHDKAWHGTTAVTAKATGGMEFWIPKGTNRFHFAGGARFVHGGAMLQEIVVPIIKIQHVKGKSSRDKTQIKQVAVQVLGSKHKITAAKHRFKLLQMDPVSERNKAITLKLAVYDGDEPVTSIETVTFDSASTNLDDRQQSIILTLQDRQYDKRTSYRLLLRDAETGIEQHSETVIIDRAILDDF